MISLLQIFNRYLLRSIFFIHISISLLNPVSHAAALLSDPKFLYKLLDEVVLEIELAENVPNDICLSLVCQKEASFFLNNINQEIDPCDDFYQFACGNFIKRAVIPKDDNSVSVISTAQNKIITQMINDVKEIEEDDIDAFKKVKIHYENCLKKPGDEATAALLNIINNFGGMPVLSHHWDEKKFNWLSSVIKIKNYGFPLAFPVQVFISTNPKDTTKHNLMISNPLTRVNKMFFLKKTNDERMKAYFKYMVEVAVMLGANRKKAMKQMEECMQFEINLYKISSPPDELGNDSTSDSQMTIKELSQRNPSIPWLDFLRGIFKSSGIILDENELLIVSDPSAIDKLEDLMATTPKKVIANYILWQAIYDAIDYLPEDFLELQFKYQKATNGIQERKSRSSFCVRDTMDNFYLAISALYVRKHVSEESLESAEKLVHNVKNQFAKMIRQARWLDGTTKSAALEKIRAMDVFIGYSNEYFDDDKLNEYYRDVEINDGTYLQTAFNLSHFYTNIMENTLRKLEDKKDWTMHANAANINAYYMQTSNYFEIPASLLQRPFFDHLRPQYLNYGNLGTTIGHEITHGFDSEGRLADKQGNLADWWDKATEKKYLRKAECFINQYSNYTVEEISLNLNGRVTHVEDIADNGGLKTAYNAYVEWTKTNNIEEPRLPGLDYSPRQMFWISAANFFCGKFSTENLQETVTQDEHSPAEARVKIPVMNSVKFAEDFGCKPGSKMNPIKKCDLW